MKQLFLIALLAITAFSAKAQHAINNGTCDIEVRQFCLDPQTCVISYFNTGWILVPAATADPITVTACNPGDIVGFEVRYASSTGCSYPSVFVQDHNYPATCPNIWHNTDLGSCSCSPNANGVNVHFNGNDIHLSN